MKRFMSLTFILALGSISCGDSKQPTAPAELIGPIAAGKALTDTEEGDTDAPANASTMATVNIDNNTHGNSKRHIFFRGSIDRSDDVDWIQVTLESGQMYRFVVLGASSSSDRTLTDPKLIGLYRGDDDYINGTSGSNLVRKSKMHYSADADAVYYVAVSSRRGETGTYDLRVLNVPDDIQPDNISTPGTIAVGGTQDGKINYRGDEDWYKAELIAGTTYQMELIRRSYVLPNFYPELYLRNSAGVPIKRGHFKKGTKNTKHSTSVISYTPAENGTYFIAATSRINRIGKYRLTLSEE